MVGRKLGRFTVTGALLRETTTDHLEKIFDKVVPVSMYSDVYRDTVEYLALSPFFDEVAEGNEAPHYTANVTVDKDGEVTSVAWVRSA